MEYEPSTDLYTVRLRLRHLAPAGSCDATIRGVFRVAGATGSGGRAEGLIRYNAPSILVGVLRGTFSALTGAAGVEVMTLPPLNIAAIVEGT